MPKKKQNKKKRAKRKQVQTDHTDHHVEIFGLSTSDELSGMENQLEQNKALVEVPALNPASIPSGVEELVNAVSNEMDNATALSGANKPKRNHKKKKKKKKSAPSASATMDSCETVSDAMPTNIMPVTSDTTTQRGKIPPPSDQAAVAPVLENGPSPVPSDDIDIGQEEDTEEGKANAAEEVDDSRNQMENEYEQEYYEAYERTSDEHRPANIDEALDDLAKAALDRGLQELFRIFGDDSDPDQLRVILEQQGLSVQKATQFIFDNKLSIRKAKDRTMSETSMASNDSTSEPPPAKQPVAHVPDAIRASVRTEGERDTASSLNHVADSYRNRQAAENGHETDVETVTGAESNVRTSTRHRGIEEAVRGMMIEEEEEERMREAMKATTIVPAAVLSKEKPDTDIEQEVIDGILGSSFSHIPDDLISTVFAFVDGFTYGKIGMVCHRWEHLQHHTPQLWRYSCGAFWEDSRESVVPHQFKSWRHMFIHRPRLRFHGAYISRVSYMRAGSTEGTYNQPVHQVVYYRYWRFFPDGKVIAVDQSEPPKLVLRWFKRDSPRVNLGEWVLQGDELFLTFYLPRAILCYHLLLKSSHPAGNNRLILLDYSTRLPESIEPSYLPLNNAAAQHFRYLKVPWFENPEAPMPSVSSA